MKALASLTLLVLFSLSGYGEKRQGQDNNSGGGGGVPSAVAARSGFSDSLSVSQPYIAVGATEMIVAVVKNTGDAPATFTIFTQVFGSSNGGALSSQTNTVTLGTNESFTQTMSFTPNAQDDFQVLTVFSQNSSSADSKNAAFHAMNF